MGSDCRLLWVNCADSQEWVLAAESDGVEQCLVLRGGMLHLSAPVWILDGDGRGRKNGGEKGIYVRNPQAEFAFSGESYAWAMRIICSKRRRGRNRKSTTEQNLDGGKPFLWSVSHKFATLIQRCVCDGVSRIIKTRSWKVSDFDHCTYLANNPRVRMVYLMSTIKIVV